MDNRFLAKKEIELQESIINETVQSDREIRLLSDILLNSLVRQIKKNKSFQAATNTGQFKDSRDWIEIQDFLNSWNITVLFAETTEYGVSGSWVSDTKTIYLAQPSDNFNPSLIISLRDFILKGQEETFIRQIKNTYARVLIHELTHAFDDYRSSGQAIKQKTADISSYVKTPEYWLSQIEINARFAETSKELLGRKLTLDTGNGFSDYIKMFQKEIQAWDIMPMWVQKRMIGRMYKEYSELSNEEKDMIFVKTSYNVLHGALKEMLQNDQSHLPSVFFDSSSDKRFSSDKAYTTNQVHTLSEFLKDYLNNPDKYENHLHHLGYLLDDIQTVINKNPATSDKLQEYFGLSKEDMSKIQQFSLWW